ncbi:UNVERIFIED_CONTAM: LysM domain-containing protein [Acetivibrio alkalicellulosi]
MKKRYTLKNKKRFCFFIAIIFITMFFIVSINNTHGYIEPSYEAIVVDRGDTLWGIAQKYNKGGDIRHYIHEIMKINNLENSNISEGSELIVIIKE